MSELLLITHPDDVVTPDGHIAGAVYSHAKWWKEAVEENVVEAVTLPPLERREDRDEWDQAAAAALQAIGYVRTGRWRNTPWGGLAARVERVDAHAAHVPQAKEDETVAGKSGERLLADLVESVIETEGGLRMIHNPFMVTLVPHGVESERSEFVAALNATFRAKQQGYASAIARWDYESAVMQWIERPYRAMAFDEVAHETKEHGKFWSLLARVWRDAENPSDYTEEWRDRFMTDRPDRHLLMSEEDYKTLQALPERVVVYRAGYDWQSPLEGLSWTLDERIARWFSRRFNAGRPLYRATVQRDKITAYWSERGESEVLIADQDAFLEIEEIA